MKAGDKVVFLDDKTLNHPLAICPKDEEILTLLQPGILDEPAWVVNEYKYSTNGLLQEIPSRLLHPLQDWQQAEYMTEELIQETLMPAEA